MKRIFILGLLFALVIPYGFSQAFVGGGLTFSYNKYNNYNDNGSSTNIGIRPLAGYRLGNFDVGLLFGYYNTNYSYLGSSSSTQIDVGIFGDYTFSSIDRLSILGRGRFQYSFYLSSDTKYLLIDVAPMFEYILLYRLTVYSSLGSISYRHYLWDDTGSFNISLLSGLTLGFRFFF